MDNSWIGAHIVWKRLGFAPDWERSEAQVLRVADVERITFAFQVLNSARLVGDRL